MLTPRGCELPEVSHKGSRARHSTPEPTPSAHSRTTSRGRRPVWGEAGRPSEGGLTRMEKCHSTHVKHHYYKYESSLAYLLDTRRTVSPNLPGHIIRITWNDCYHGFLDQAWLTGCQGSSVLDRPLQLGVSRGRWENCCSDHREGLGSPRQPRFWALVSPPVLWGGDDHNCPFSLVVWSRG